MGDRGCTMSIVATVPHAGTAQGPNCVPPLRHRHRIQPPVRVVTESRRWISLPFVATNASWERLLRDRVPLLVRPRGDADLDACARVARVIHELDGYPPYLPDDIRSFISEPEALAAWGAERDGEIIGHVALNPRSSQAVLTLASEALRQPPERFGVVARLLVAPGARRKGVGRSLFEAATDSAVDRGLRPILDVAIRFHAAINLYEKCGWLRLGEVTVRFKDGTVLDEFVYFWPAEATDIE